MLIISNKNMTLKEYRKVRWVFVVLTAVIFSQTLYYKNYFIPIAFLIVASLVHLFLRRQVREVLADERDYVLAGKSALIAIQIYSWIAVIAMFIFYGMRDMNPAYGPIGMTLAFSAMILLLINSVFFRYFESVSLKDWKLAYTFLVLVMFSLLFVIGIRGLSGEDSWICENGRWVQHGHPAFPAPEVECR